MRSIPAIIAIAAAAGLGAADSVTATFEPGALSSAGAPFPAAAAAPTIATILFDAVPDTPARNQMVVAATGQRLARSNGHGDNGTATDIFAYRNQSWSLTVPIGVGEYTGLPGAQRMAYTPSFSAGSVKLYTSYMGVGGGKAGLFKAPASAGGPIAFGQWSTAYDPVANRTRLFKDGLLAARTNGHADNGPAVGLAVAQVRTAIADDGAGRIANIYREVPFVIIAISRAVPTQLLATPTARYQPGTIGNVKLFDAVGQLAPLAISGNG